MPAIALGMLNMVMIAAALAMQTPQSRPSPALVQATATIRVVSAVRLRLDAPTNPDAPATHGSIVHAADGTTIPAKLIEFQ
jgi:hypothetical protein